MKHWWGHVLAVSSILAIISPGMVPVDDRLLNHYQILSATVRSVSCLVMLTRRHQRPRVTQRV